MALIDLKTDLKSLKYSQFGNAAPLIQKDHKKAGNLYNSLPREISARTDDVARLTQLVGRNPQFTLRQILLRTTGNNLKQRLQSLPKAAPSALGTVVSFLGQTAVAGTGVHLIHETDQIKSQLNNYYIGDSAAKYALQGTPILDTNVESKFGNIPLEQRKKEINKEVKKYTDGNISTIFNAPQEAEVDLIRPREGFFEPRYTGNLSSDSKRKGSIDISVKSQNTLEFNLETSRKNRPDSLNTSDVIKTSELFGYDSLQIIPFRIEIITPKISVSSNTENLLFRAYLTDLNDNYSSTWNEVGYIGRGEKLYIYGGNFDRSISFGFKIAAESQKELVPLYNKLNRLVGTLSPDYNENGSFMRGIFVRLTIGDYFQSLPGFFPSIGLSWSNTYPWEIGKNESGENNETPRVPHVLDVTATFTSVHSFIPQFGQEYIGTQRI